jgi:hypothetical protein
MEWLGFELRPHAYLMQLSYLELSSRDNKKNYLSSKIKGKNYLTICFQISGHNYYNNTP